jgi:HAD superfamily hydrolase (TIGR01549 family)
MCATPTLPILVIFDFDNTLIDSRIRFADLRAALIDLWATRGQLPAPREEIIRWPLRDIVDRAGETDPDLRGAAWATIEAYEAEGLAGAEAIPHAHGVLEALAARGVRLALLTNNARAATATNLERLGLTGLLDVTITRDEVAALKPDASGVRLILERVGPVAVAYLVGDSWIDGLAAASAGIRFIGFGARRAEVEARGVRPWTWVGDLRELLTLDLRA